MLRRVGNKKKKPKSITKDDNSMGQFLPKDLFPEKCRELGVFHDHVKSQEPSIFLDQNPNLLLLLHNII